MSTEIICGDAREVLREMRFDGPVTCITDPVWPDTDTDFPCDGSPYQLFAEAMALLPQEVVRLAVVLGCDSNPRFLCGVSERFHFFRVCWLELVQPHYKGRLLYTSDVAYLFGPPPRPQPGQFLIPGKMTDTSSDGKQSKHPAPRKLAHMKWLVKWWSEPDDIILDPFCGSGTTLVAATAGGRQSIGIEINPDYCLMARERNAQMALPGGRGSPTE